MIEQLIATLRGLSYATLTAGTLLAAGTVLALQLNLINLQTALDILRSHR